MAGLGLLEVGLVGGQGLVEQVGGLDEAGMVPGAGRHGAGAGGQRLGFGGQGRFGAGGGGGRNGRRRLFAGIVEGAADGDVGLLGTRPARLASEHGLEIGIVFQEEVPETERDAAREQQEQEELQAAAARRGIDPRGGAALLLADQRVRTGERDRLFGGGGEIDGVGARAGPVARLEQDGAFVVGGIGRQRGFARLDLVDVLEDVGPRRRALGGILGRHLGEQPAVGHGQMREDFAGVGQVVGLLGFEDFFERAAFERRPAGEQMVEREAEGIHVAAAIGFAAFDLLGGDVGGGALDAFGGRARGGGAGDARQAQVGQLHRAVRAEQDVAGFHVAVDQARFAPGGVEGAGDDGHQLQRLAVGHALVLGDPFGEVGARDVFHHVVQRAVVLAEIHDADDGRMRQARGGAGFLLELFARAGVGEQRGRKHLDGDDAVERELLGQPDGRRAAGAEQLLDLVARQRGRNGMAGRGYHGNPFWTKAGRKETAKLARAAASRGEAGSSGGRRGGRSGRGRSGGRADRAGGRCGGCRCRGGIRGTRVR